MNPTAYEVVFDIERTGYRGWPPAALILMFTVVVLAILRARASEVEVRRRTNFREFSLAVGVLMAMLAGLASYLTWNEYRSLRDACATRSFTVVEGTVSDFRMPESKREKPSFVVGGVRFAYPSRPFAASFDGSEGDGGPLRDGLHLRIGHVDGAIVKLEIAR